MDKRKSLNNLEHDLDHNNNSCDDDDDDDDREEVNDDRGDDHDHLAQSFICKECAGADADERDADADGNHLPIVETCIEKLRLR